MKYLISLLIFCIIFTAQLFGGPYEWFFQNRPLPYYQVEIISQIPHDTASFTQGLIFYKGYLYESTGLYGKSSFNKIDPSTGKTVESMSLDSSLFGEGLTICEKNFYQITWQEKTAFVYRTKDMEYQDQWTYDTEGWGLTTIDNSLVMTDGSPTLYYRSSKDFSLEKKSFVTIGDRGLGALNELEYVDGVLYANILGEDYIVEIDPISAKVIAIIDARSLRQTLDLTNPEQVLNGIAYDSAHKEFYLTGKLWPTIYKVRFVRSLGQ